MRIFSGHFFSLIFITLMLATKTLCSNAFAQAVFLPERVPTPSARPFLIMEKEKKSYHSINTIINNNPSFHEIVAISQLKLGLDALFNADITTAISLRNSMAPNSLNRHILTWAINTSDQINIPSYEIFNTIKELKGWPNLTIMQRNAERAFIRETHSAQAILQKFSHHSPLTAQGMAAFTQALLLTKQSARARQVLAPWWHKTKLTAEDERLIFHSAKTILKPDDHLKRLKFMLYAHRLDSAERIASLARAQSLFNAFVAVEKNDPNAAKKLRSVHPIWTKDPLLQFAQIRYLRRTGEYSAAAKLIMKTSRDAENLTNPDRWWKERRALSREMLDLKKPKIAYQLVATHTYIKPLLAVDAEFHAGWYALRFLHNPQLAMHHFARIPQLSSTPISKSRGYYWMGRAAEAFNEHEKALHYFQQAAHFGVTYYGQLAAARLNRKKLEIHFPKPTMAERQRFSTRKAVKVIKRLEAVGYAHLAKIIYKELSKKIESPGELALLAVMAEKNNDYHTSLKIGKIASFQGKNVGALSHPIGAIPASTNISTTEKALIYAIARQESEFNPTAISTAGARGMLQLLPTTAKELARKHSIAWSAKKFSSDANYSATLGAHFLDEQLKRFNGSYILTIISYNAGPRRAKEWTNRYGDPRGQPLDKVVDWIERIPYTETRNYVMRVMENYEVYKARLTGTADIKTHLTAGY
ncbi:lytic transglycosylase domain-containing protein [Bartonella sp. F02]|uniref:lytic transglycosylase domain-containing protein n=1 Tax=Bartonella sp. F02 TaxID=2967262 RepID=UPI0022A9A4EC|nr:lytic transglycosylase domain-containing protein [Bartonella sp. F02]MCZ2328523.1 lytic transglycosylase domain-containing protein [Bartonella sp. F02]